MTMQVLEPCAKQSLELCLEIYGSYEIVADQINGDARLKLKIIEFRFSCGADV